MKQKKRKKIILIAVIGLVLVISILAVDILTRDALYIDAHAKLDAAVNMKAVKINSYFNKRGREIQVMRSIGSVKNYFDKAAGITPRKGKEWMEAVRVFSLTDHGKKVRRDLQQTLFAYGYDTIILLDVNGYAVMSAGKNPNIQSPLPGTLVFNPKQPASPLEKLCAELIQNRMIKHPVHFVYQTSENGMDWEKGGVFVSIVTGKKPGATGLLLAKHSLTDLREILSLKILAPASGEMFIMEKNQRVLAGSGGKNATAPGFRMPPAANERRDNALINKSAFTNHKGKKVLAASRLLNELHPYGIDWTLAAEVEKTDIAGFRHWIVYIALGIGVLLLITGIVAYFKGVR